MGVSETRSFRAESESCRLDVGGKLLVCDVINGGKNSPQCTVASMHSRCSSGHGAKFGILRPNLSGGKISTVDNKEGRFRPKVLRSYVVAAAWMAGSCTDDPSCIFVGPIETAEKAQLEALYQQARDSYYSGQPLVVDDMFDKVEVKLRFHKSNLVVKYPRCSLKRYTAYADAEFDPSQMRALATVWGFLFALGLGLAVVLPVLITRYMSISAYEPGAFVLSDMNRVLFSVVSFLVGAPVAMSAAKQLQALGQGDVMALKGCCPNCGAEVYTFVRPNYSSLEIRHESECHVCDRQLMFQATLHPSWSGPGQPWAHGRVYLRTGANQLVPVRLN